MAAEGAGEQQAVPKSRLEKLYENFITRMDEKKEEIHRELCELQFEYLNSKGESFAQLVYFYTNMGDNILNTFLRNNKDINSLSLAEKTNFLKYLKEAYKSYNKLYKNKNTAFFKGLEVFKTDDINEINYVLTIFYEVFMLIFMEIPKYNKSFYVARGSLKLYTDKNISLLSTSLSTDTAGSFATLMDDPENIEKQCADDPNYQFLKSMKIQKNTPFIYLPALMKEMIIDAKEVADKPAFIENAKENWNQIETEYEVLLPPEIIVIKPIKTYIIKDAASHPTKQKVSKHRDICGFETYEVYANEFDANSELSPHTLNVNRTPKAAGGGRKIKTRRQKNRRNRNSTRK